MRIEIPESDMVNLIEVGAWVQGVLPARNPAFMYAPVWCALCPNEEILFRKPCSATSENIAVLMGEDGYGTIPTGNIASAIIAVVNKYFQLAIIKAGKSTPAEEADRILIGDGK